MEGMSAQSTESKDYRVPGEKKVLYASLGLIAFALFIWTILEQRYRDCRHANSWKFR